MNQQNLKKLFASKVSLKSIMSGGSSKGKQPSQKQFIAAKPEPMSINNKKINAVGSFRQMKVKMKIAYSAL